MSHHHHRPPNRLTMDAFLQPLVGRRIKLIHVGGARDEGFLDRIETDAAGNVYAVLVGDGDRLIDLGDCERVKLHFSPKEARR